MVGKELVPRLRFPEFRGTGGWAVVPLDQLAKRVTDRNTFGESGRVLTNSAERGVLDQRDFFDKDIANQDNLSNYFVVEKGDFVYNPRVSVTAAVGPISKNRIGRGVMSPLYSVFRFSVANDEFFAHYFKTPFWHPYLRKVSSTGARHDRMSIGIEDFMAMPLPTPAAPEQQKVAACLSSLDDLIAAEIQTLDTLKVYKKGLMQQLFPQEGETVPRLRFPEFRGAWKTQALVTLAVYENGKSYEPHIVERGQYVVVNSRFISTEGTVRKYSNEDLCTAHRGDVLMVLSDLPGGRALAKCFYVDSDDLYGVNQRVCRLTPHSIDGRFLFFGLNRHQKLLAYDDGINQTHLAKESVLKCPISVPPTRNEQERIASVLTHLDQRISAQAQKIDALKTHKKGLMQGLFPSMKEMSRGDAEFAEVSP